MTHMSELSIDLKAIKENYNLLNNKTGADVVCGASVKANAYGLGISSVSLALKQAGCSDFFVAHPNEAFELRRILNEHDTNDLSNIYCLHGYQEAFFDAFYTHKITPILASLPQIESWILLQERHAVKIPAFIHFDTGMNRLGLDPHETTYFLEHLDNFSSTLDVSYILSHMACADEKDHPRNAVQKSRFDKLRDEILKHKQCTDWRFSLANSSSIYLGDDYFYDMVRPGMALYGLNPTPYQETPMKPVVGLTTPILQVRDLKAGEAVGYGATKIVHQGSRLLATVQMGYADGIHLVLSNVGSFFIDGVSVDIVGRVSMDLIILDITDHPNKNICAGMIVEIIGNNQSVDRLASDANTIGYEVLTSIGNSNPMRIKRSYK